MATYLAAGTLGEDLRAYVAGNSMTSLLRTEVTAYQLCMLDDSIQEGPHARISRIVTASRSGRPPWWSAGVRIEQNLEARASLEPLPKPLHQVLHKLEDTSADKTKYKAITGTES